MSRWLHKMCRSRQGPLAQCHHASHFPWSNDGEKALSGLHGSHRLMILPGVHSGDGSSQAGVVWLSKQAHFFVRCLGFSSMHRCWQKTPTLRSRAKRGEPDLQKGEPDICRSMVIKQQHTEPENQQQQKILRWRGQLAT